MISSWAKLPDRQDAAPAGDTLVVDRVRRCRLTMDQMTGMPAPEHWISRGYSGIALWFGADDHPKDMLIDLGREEVALTRMNTLKSREESKFITWLTFETIETCSFA